MKIEIDIPDDLIRDQLVCVQGASFTTSCDPSHMGKEDRSVRVAGFNVIHDVENQVRLGHGGSEVKDDSKAFFSFVMDPDLIPEKAYPYATPLGVSFEVSVGTLEALIRDQARKFIGAARHLVEIMNVMPEKGVVDRQRKLAGLPHNHLGVYNQNITKGDSESLAADMKAGQEAYNKRYPIE
jgi:hypothetical protein